jgi:hypothetical protein
MQTPHEPGRHNLPRRDLRRNDRRPCDHNVKVMWRDLAGQDKFTHAKALDISELGLRLQMPEALPHQAYLGLNGPSWGSPDMPPCATAPGFAGRSLQSALSSPLVCAGRQKINQSHC